MSKLLLPLALALAAPVTMQALGAPRQEPQRLPRIPNSAVNQAITRGTEWLVASQFPTGTWPYSGLAPRPGNTALAVYTLLKSGLSTDHEAIGLGFDALRKIPPTGTYGRALLLMALAAHHGDGDSEWAAAVARDLLRTQSGDFGYGGNSASGGDLSNTQYGALGLRAAAQLGIEVSDSAWHALAKATLDYTDSGYGFAYSPGAKQLRPTGSMTSAGAAILNICIEALGQSGTAPKELDRYISARDHGLEWLGAHFSVDQNYAGGWLGYYLYGLERVGSLCAVTQLGSHDWYNEGATKLVRAQRPSGSWALGGSGPVTSTAYALLFLRRATGPVVSGAPQTGKSSFTSSGPDEQVTLVASGDLQLDLWLGNWKQSALERFEWPGETGQGPHVVRVIYRLDRRIVATIEGDAAHPSKGARFPTRLLLDGGGAHHLKASIEVAMPPHTIQAVELAGPHVLIETELEFELPNALEPWQLANQRDRALNLVQAGRPKAKASSAAPLAELQAALGLAAGFPLISNPELAIDNRSSTAWIAAESDTSPTLRLTFKTPPLANRILIANAHVLNRVQPRLGRVATLLVTINRREKFHMSMPPNELEKALLKLPKPIKIRKLEIEITSRVPGKQGYRAVGLSEVELQLIE